jgi:hypothetical protein
MPVLPIALLVVFAVLADDCLDGFLKRLVVKLGGQRKNISSMTEKIVANLSVNL